MGKKTKKKKSKGKKSKKGKGKAAASSDKSREAPDCGMLEAKLETLNATKEQYRVAAHKLFQENETLEQQFERSEKDTLEVVSFLQKEENRKDAQISSLQQTVKEMNRRFEMEKKTMTEDYTQQIYKLQEVLMEKSDEVKLMQAELKLVKEFRKKRATMQKELDEIKDALYMTEKQQQDNLSYMEKKFLEEKVRLQKEANFKIAELAQHAHSEAVGNLEETTRNVYKENIRLNDALGYHLDEGDTLKKSKQHLEAKNKELLDEKELNSLLVQEKVIENQQLKGRLRLMEDKLLQLESIVSEMKDTERKREQRTGALAIAEAEHDREAIAKLQRLLSMKAKECSRIKLLARRILDERSDVEQFLLDSLQMIRREINESRMQYKKDAEAAYTARMLQAERGHMAYPRVRTFNDLLTSTNDVHAEMDGACALQPGRDTDSVDRLSEVNATAQRIAFSELTWEQREKVLRALFAKINSSRQTAAEREQQEPARQMLEGPTAVS